MSERKLVRARPKAVEYLPEWAKCCAELRDGILAWPEMIVDVSRVWRAAPGPCRFCGSEKPVLIFVLDVETLHYAPTDVIDLDEGSIERGR